MRNLETQGIVEQARWLVTKVEQERAFVYERTYHDFKPADMAHGQNELPDAFTWFAERLGRRHRCTMERTPGKLRCLRSARRARGEHDESNMIGVEFAFFLLRIGKDLHRARIHRDLAVGLMRELHDADAERIDDHALNVLFGKDRDVVLVRRVFELDLAQQALFIG